MHSWCSAWLKRRDNFPFNFPFYLLQIPATLLVTFSKFYFFSLCMRMPGQTLEMDHNHLLPNPYTLTVNDHPPITINAT